jgi:hypothetical protein
MSEEKRRGRWVWIGPQAEREEAPPKRTTETSKKVLKYALVFCAIWGVVVLVGWFSGLEDAPTMAGVPAGVAAIVIGFYEWKAKAENMLKIGRSMGAQGAKTALEAVLKKENRGEYTEEG